MISLKTYNSKFFPAVYLFSLIVSLTACKSEVSESEKSLDVLTDTTLTAPKETVPEKPKPMPEGLHSRLELRNDCILFSETLKRAAYFNQIATELGPFTVFVPTEMNAEKFKSQDSLNWVGHYIVANNYSSPVLHNTITDFVPQLNLKTLAGTSLVVSRSGDTLFAKDSKNNLFRLAQTDVLAANGVIHIMVKATHQ